MDSFTITDYRVRELNIFQAEEFAEMDIRWIDAITATPGSRAASAPYYVSLSIHFAYCTYYTVCIYEVSLRIPRWGQLLESRSEMSYEASL